VLVIDPKGGRLAQALNFPCRGPRAAVAAGPGGGAALGEGWAWGLKTAEGAK
jgi:hypothetical protein